MFQVEFERRSALETVKIVLLAGLYGLLRDLKTAKIYFVRGELARTSILSYVQRTILLNQKVC